MRFLDNYVLKIAVLTICGCSAASAFATSTCKTVRVEHGRPVIVVSQNEVLLLEFLKEPAKDSRGTNELPDVNYCRAKYRFQVFNGASGSVTDGEGMLEEHYRVVSQSTTGKQLVDIGCHTQIAAGEFLLTWSQASAGQSSWLYFRGNSGVRFVQQPQQITFESANKEMFERYLSSKNVEEFVSAGQIVQVIGPAIFSDDLPTERPTSARVESGRVKDGVFALKLSNLVINKSYAIESSYEVKAGSWNAVHVFIAREPNHEWSEPLGKDVNTAFYRIRQEGY